MKSKAIIKLFEEQVAQLKVVCSFEPLVDNHHINNAILALLGKPFDVQLNLFSKSEPETPLASAWLSLVLDQCQNVTIKAVKDFHQEDNEESNKAFKTIINQCLKAKSDESKMVYDVLIDTLDNANIDGCLAQWIGNSYMENDWCIVDDKIEFQANHEGTMEQKFTIGLFYNSDEKGGTPLFTQKLTLQLPHTLDSEYRVGEHISTSETHQALIEIGNQILWNEYTDNNDEQLDEATIRFALNMLTGKTIQKFEFVDTTENFQQCQDSNIVIAYFDDGTHQQYQRETLDVPFFFSEKWTNITSEK